VVDDAVRAAIAPLEDGDAELLSRVVELTHANDLVRALWLAGSVGRGTADGGSDLDLVATVTDRAPLADPHLWDALDPVIVMPIPGKSGSFALATRQGLRVDLVLETTDEVATSSYTSRVRVFDRDGLELPATVDDESPLRPADRRGHCRQRVASAPDPDHQTGCDSVVDGTPATSPQQRRTRDTAGAAEEVDRIREGSM